MRGKYAYEDLSDAQFERLVVQLCQRLLGASVQGFSSGPDGGRDARFEGTAEMIPSKSAPWTGKVVVQAKHTGDVNRTFYEPDFFSAKSNSSIVANEIPRIKGLRAQGELDHYMLFSNRRLSGGSESLIRNHISGECEIPSGSILLCGTETLNSWLKQHPEAAVEADLDPIDSPLLVSPDDLAKLVHSLHENLEGLVKQVGSNAPVARISYEEKNKLNNLSPEYERKMRKGYLKDVEPIRTFLAAPENTQLRELYEEIAEEFQYKIIAHRRDYQEFARVLERLMSVLLGRDPDLRRKKRLTRAVLFYMYWNCDIGEVVGDVEAVEALTS